MIGNKINRVLCLSIWLLIVTFTTDSIPGCNCRVLELSDRFLDVRKEGIWLIKFYAPYCGHCKKLEPIWNQVAQSLHYSSVRVGRVDCTRFTALASEYNIRGFPTILFLNGDTTYTYKGDRNREDIVEFALRLEGPALRDVKDREHFDRLTEKHEVFFLVVGNKDDDSELWVAFERLAKIFHAYLHFYRASIDAVSEDIRLHLLAGGPSLFVIKDGTHYIFQIQPNVGIELNDSLAQWVNRERFPFFVKVTHGSLPQMIKSEKLIVIGILDENLVGKFTPEMETFRAMLKQVALEHKEELHKSFLFGWTPYASLANSLAMQRLPVPGLIVLNSVTYEYYIPNDDPSELTPNAILAFLGQIVDKSAKVYGGNGIGTKIYRVYYDSTTSLAEMWSGNPVLTTVLFGLPFGFLLLILYSICCQDIMDASDEDIDEDEFDERQSQPRHEKRE